MKLDKNGYDLIKGFEGLKLDAYLDSVGVWTIGYGSTQYENFAKVKKGDKVSMQRAEEIFKYFADRFAKQVNDLIKKPLTQNQFNAIVSLAYNIGIGAFSNSTALKKINVNPNDPTIKLAIEAWNKGTVNGKKVVINGLKNRREKESKLYFTN